MHGVPWRVYKHAPRSLRDVFATTAAHGDKEFVVYRDERITFREHLGLVAGLARHLSETHGVGHGDRVAIGMRNYPEWVISFWATVSLGAIAVPLNAWWTGPELTYAIRDSGTRVLILDDERWARLAPHLEELDIAATIVSRLRDEAPPHVTPWERLRGELDLTAALPDVPIAPDDHATIMYTSGTTGAPKGALATHRNHCTNIMNTLFLGALALAMAGQSAPPSDVPQPAALQVFPFFHIGGLTGLYMATTTGTKLVTMYKWDVDAAVELLANERITSTSLVPMVLRQLLDSPQLERVPPEALAGIASGGAPVPPDLIRRIESQFDARVAPANGYGLTETTSAIVINYAQDYFTHPDSIGRAVLGADVKIVGADGQEVPNGEVGELWVRGPNVVDGYWNKPDETAATFTDGWFHSGDLARRDDDGFFYVVDRLKDVVIRGGENVYSAEVEAVLFEHPAVEDVAVVGLPHPVYGEEVVAVVNLRRGHDQTTSELQQFAAERLARFKVPSQIVVRSEALPRTASGKVLKRSLRDELTRAAARRSEV